MPRFFLSFALLLLVGGHMLSLTVIRVGFELERSRIEQQLCENRDRPEVGCHGSCVLRKMLQRAEETSTDQQRRKTHLLAGEYLPAEGWQAAQGVQFTARPPLATTWARRAAWIDPGRSGRGQPPESMPV